VPLVTAHHRSRRKNPLASGVGNQRKGLVRNGIGWKIQEGKTVSDESSGAVWGTVPDDHGMEVRPYIRSCEN
jgi:hypothetical protein